MAAFTPQTEILPLVVDLDPGLTPDVALQAISDRWTMPILLESCLQRPNLGRYSFLTADPWQTFVIDKAVYGLDPFSEVRDVLAKTSSSHRADLPPFQGGAAGLLCYDLGRCWERLPVPPHDRLKIPPAVIGLYDWVIAWDHLQGTCRLISQGFPETCPEHRSRRAEDRANLVQGILKKLELDTQKSGRTNESRGAGAVRHAVTEIRSNFTREEYLAAVDRVIEYIRAGDIFQANLSQCLSTAAVDPPLEMYLKLRKANPATFAGYLAAEDWAVISSSPERFLQVAGNTIRTRPIKGTRRRRNHPEADLFSRDELRESEKDRAENVMIVDLLRNDLSRVCKPGTVRVPELCSVETYETVTHLVSEVSGELEQGMTFWDAIAAAFPGGSITGAPKVRAMEVITEIEQVSRGPYCGSLFYCGFDGWADSSILIRTMTQRGELLQFPVGGGIVVRSSPAAEYQETLDKASGMQRALAVTSLD